MIDVTEQHQDAALARKRRIELRSKHRNEPSEKRVCIREDDEDPEEIPSEMAPRQKPLVRGVKIHARYDPGVPMTKDELVAWRKEARRVRNRESAAASRKRTRDRIDELEGQVTEIKTKYSAALERILQLESLAAAHNLVVPPTSSVFPPQDLSLVSPCSSTSTPSISPQDTFTLSPEEEQNQEATEKYQHVTEMISRQAAKITGADTFPSSDSSSSPSYECSSGATNEISSDSSSSSGEEHEHEFLQDTELGSFLLDALSDFDPTGDDAVEVVAL